MCTTIKKHEIFVSYAEVDNKAFEGENHGQVTTFINNLKNFLGKKLGHSDLSLWMDYELQENTTIIAETAKQAKILLWWNTSS